MKNSLQLIFHETVFVYYLPVEKVPFFYHLPMDEIEEGKILGPINGTLIKNYKYLELPVLVDGKKGKALYFNEKRETAEFGLIP